jgi:hypothetical protein
MLFKEIIGVYSHNRTWPLNMLFGQTAELLIFKAGGTHSYRYTSKNNNGCIFFEVLFLHNVPVPSTKWRWMRSPNSKIRAAAVLVLMSATNCKINLKPMKSFIVSCMAFTLSFMEIRQFV